MCSNGDTDIVGETLIPIVGKKKFDLNTKCTSCHEVSPLVVLKRKYVYCKDCFLYKVTHKFRSALGKSKKMRPSDKVLVAFSGGMSSVALLHMLMSGKNEQVPKKLMYDIVFCYIDDGAVIATPIEKRIHTIQENAELVKLCGFEFYKSTLNKSLSDGNPLLGDINPEEDDGLLLLLNQIPSITAKEDLLLKLRQRLLINIAKTLNCNKIFTAENQNCLSVKLLSSLAVGRGEQVSLEVGFEDDRYEGVLLLRPMRDIEAKEIVYYNHFHNLTWRTRPRLSTGMANTASISRLTSHFITDLQQEFPATVSTIYRTGEKLSTVSKNEVDPDSLCLLCHGNLKLPEDSLFSAVDATAFSRKVSSCKTQSTSSCCGGGSCGKTDTFTNNQLQTCFCYGCLLIVHEMENLGSLPAALTEAIMRRNSLQSMREQIAGFLL